MSLRALITSFDDDALIALANKGLLRRAQKAVPEAQVQHYDDDEARVQTGGQTVTIPAGGPQTATCDCPATGVCSHILTAVLVLRDSSEPTDAEPATPEGPTVSASDWLAGLTADQLRKFAGADFDGAAVLAATAHVEQRGGNAQASFPSPEATVTFVAGQDLKAALYKGPATRKRLVVAAGAIALRDLAGVARGAPLASPNAAPAPDSETMDAILRALEEAIGQIFHGSAVLAEERLLDLAISAKVQSAPRLMGQLMTLSTQAGWAEADDVRFEGGRFLAALSRTYALARAIRLCPDDTGLLGQARRSYQPVADMTLMCLGLHGWTTPNGARGLTAYFLDQETGEHRSATVARGAGMDLAFTAYQAYSNPLWGTPAASRLSGSSLVLENPLCAEDGQISTGDKTRAKDIQPLRTSDVQNSPALIRRWSDLRADLRVRMGKGLRRAAAPVPSLILPHSISEPQFDDISQRYVWRATDAEGQTLDLIATPDDRPRLAKLHTQFPGAVALLVLTSVVGDDLIHEPVTLLLSSLGDVEAVDVKFRDLPAGSALARAKAGLLQGFQRLTGSSGTPLQTAFPAQVLSQLAEQCRHLQPDTLARLAAGAEARQLLILADRLEGLKTHQAPEDILATAYLCQEAMMILALTD